MARNTVLQNVIDKNEESWSYSENYIRIIHKTTSLASRSLICYQG